MNAGVSLSRFSGPATQRRLVWFAVAALLLVNVPVFLSMRLNGDATFYDLQVQCVSEGGVLYRDMLEPNLPGVVWIHAAVRAVCGWSSVALRSFDLAVLAGVITFFAAGLTPRRHPVDSPAHPGAIPAALLALACLWFYFSLTTWSHCQRDMWMLLPSLGAVALRARVCRDLASGGRPSLLLSFFEGCLWAAAFWIKPHIAIPAIVVLLVSLRITGFSRRNWLTVMLVVVGGGICGGVGSGWLIASGAWPHFWETQLEWNPEYLASRSRWDGGSRLVGIYQSFSPWSFAHLVAFPVALAELVRTFWNRSSSHDSTEPDGEGQIWQCLLSALYLGWLLQSFGLQHSFSYTHVPGVLLAMAVVAGVRWPQDWQLVPRTAVVLVLAIAAVTSPCTNMQRLNQWWSCLDGPTLENRARLQARPGQYWADYPAVIRYLQSQGVRGRDVFVYSSALVPLYRDLDLRPPNRYVLPDVQRAFFASRAGQMKQAISSSPARFVVTDLSGVGLQRNELERVDPATGLPVALPSDLATHYPLTQPVVFRSGWFLVHEARDARGWRQNQE